MFLFRVYPDESIYILGVFICSECSGIHRRILGREFSVRAVKFGRWSTENIESMKNMGNEAANNLYCKNVPPYMHKPAPKDSHAIKSNYIKTKYAPLIKSGGESSSSEATLSNGTSYRFLPTCFPFSTQPSTS